MSTQPILDKLETLAACYPERRNLTPDDQAKRFQAYLDGIRFFETTDVIEACDRILFSDEFFPSIARLRSVIQDCRSDRLRRESETNRAKSGPLVCGRCKGARLLRLGGASPVNTSAGHKDEGARVIACPDCTRDGRYDADQERRSIKRSGGVRDEQNPPFVDKRKQTWPEKLASFRRENGEMDMAALYRYSRELRGLDPDVDERTKSKVPGFKTVGEVGIE